MPKAILEIYPAPENCVECLLVDRFAIDFFCRQNPSEKIDSEVASTTRASFCKLQIRECLGDMIGGEEARIQKHINDPETRVWIHHNCDMGYWVYAVSLCDEDFWLESFKTKKAALQYIKENKLRIGAPE